MIAISSLILGCQTNFPTDNKQQENSTLTNFPTDTKPVVQDNSLPDESKNNYHPIIIEGNILIGGFNRGKWFEQKDIYSKVADGTNLNIYSFDKYIGKGIVKLPKLQEDIDDNIININVKDIEYNSNFIALASNWNALPRIPKNQKNSSTYKKVIKDILTEKGITDSIPINIKQNIKVDIEGDGIDEVIINAENVNPVNGSLIKNSYSLLFLRKIINGQVNNLFIAEDVVGSNTDETLSVAISYMVKAILDFNGDGKLEILVESQYVDGVGYLLYEIEGNQLKLLLEHIIGV